VRLSHIKICAFIKYFGSAFCLSAAMNSGIEIWRSCTRVPGVSSAGFLDRKLPLQACYDQQTDAPAADRRLNFYIIFIPTVQIFTKFLARSG
jgi:hypothetical protein